MIQKMFALRDLKAQAYLQPFFSSANGSAIRALSDAVNDKSSPISKHPEDYVLYEIGVFDDVNGEVLPIVPIKLIVNASDFVEVTGRVVPEVIDGTKPS